MRRAVHRMRYLRIAPGAGLPDLSPALPFKAVLVVEMALDARFRDAVSQWLVRCGCRYVVAWGDDCEAWREAVRAANLEILDVERFEPRDFVMTTSHPHESLRAVFWYAKNGARHTDVRLDEIVVVHLSSADRAAECEALFRRA